MVPIVFVGENSGWLMFPGRLAKREKSGISNKNVQDITYLQPWWNPGKRYSRAVGVLDSAYINFRELHRICIPECIPKCFRGSGQGFYQTSSAPYWASESDLNYTF